MWRCESRLLAPFTDRLVMYASMVDWDGGFERQPRVLDPSWRAFGWGRASTRRKSLLCNSGRIPQFAHITRRSVNGAGSHEHGRSKLLAIDRAPSPGFRREFILATP